MKLMNHVSEKDDGVSPVVGVMLMLVVTIIIAAVVALFASGVVVNQEPAANAVIKLDSYKTGTLLYTGWGSYAYVDDSFEYGFNETKANTTSGNYGAFGIYNMTFSHNGGDKLLTKDLTLAITCNAATFELPLSNIYNSSVVSAGDKIGVFFENVTEFTDGKLFGLGQQDIYMSGYGTPGFSWALKDGGNNVIATGTVIESWWSKK